MKYEQTIFFSRFFEKLSKTKPIERCGHPKLSCSSHSESGLQVWCLKTKLQNRFLQNPQKGRFAESRRSAQNPEKGKVSESRRFAQNPQKGKVSESRRFAQNPKKGRFVPQKQNPTRILVFHRIPENPAQSYTILRTCFHTTCCFT